MTTTDEGQRALEAAAASMKQNVKAVSGVAFNSVVMQGYMREAIAAYLDALPGWRLVPIDILERARAMLEEHYNWADGVDRVGRGADKDIVIVSLPNRVRIIDTSHDLRDTIHDAPPPPGLEPDSHD